jgi:hypothetical protein
MELIYTFKGKRIHSKNVMGFSDPEINRKGDIVDIEGNSYKIVDFSLLSEKIVYILKEV